MKTKILLFALIISSAVNAQKCKYDFEKQDPFTGKSQKGITTVLAGFSVAAFRMTLQTEDKKFQTGLTIALPGRNDNYIAKGDTLSIVLDSGEIFTFRTVDQYLPNVQYVMGNVFTYYMPFYAISEEQVKKLEASPIKATKLKVGAQPLVVEVEKGKAKKLQQAAACILK